MEITYDLIQSLIVSSEAQGSRMNCEFEVPGTGEIISSTASIRRDKSITGQIKQRVTRTMTSRARVTVSQMMRGILGGGMLGRIGSQVVNTASRGVTQDLTRGYSSSEKEAAIVEAFQKVAKSFRYDEVLGWQKSAVVQIEKKTRSSRTESTAEKKKVARNASEFEKLVAKNPITNGFEQDVLARMLVEIAKADGGISSDEEEFLKDFLPDYESFLSKPLLNPIECEEVSKSSKITIYAVSWVVALVDLELDPLEEAKLYEFGEWFGLSDRNIDDTVTIAKSYMMEQSLSPDSTNDDAIAAGKLLGMSEQDSLRTFIKYKKRIS